MVSCVLFDKQMSVYFYFLYISFHYCYNVVLYQRHHFNTYVGLHDSFSGSLAAHYLAGISRQGLKVDTYV